MASFVCVIDANLTGVMCCDVRCNDNERCNGKIVMEMKDDCWQLAKLCCERRWSQRVPVETRRVVSC
jgi:hypothetical protein